MSIETINVNIDSVDNASKELDSIVDAIVIKYSKELDDYIAYVKAVVDDTSKPIMTEELEDMILTIPALLYFLGDSQELLGVREDIAKMDKTNKTNDSIINAQGGTVDYKRAVADLSTRNEALVYIVFSRARKRLQNKYEMALEVLQSVKKVLSRRMAELELSKNTVDRLSQEKTQKNYITYANKKAK